MVAALTYLRSRAEGGRGRRDKFDRAGAAISIEKVPPYQVTYFKIGAMEVVPTEYIWHYNPVTGRVAGAQQNYGERINILQTNRHLYNRMQLVQKEQNNLASAKGLATLQGSGYVHYVPSAYQTSTAEVGEEDELHGGAAPDQVDNLTTLALAAEAGRAQETNRLTTADFVQEFPPVVYHHPFDGPNVPLEFDPLYSPEGNEFSPKTFTGGSVQYTGAHPKLVGGAIVLRGQNPALGKT